MQEFTEECRKHDCFLKNNKCPAKCSVDREGWTAGWARATNASRLRWIKLGNGSHHQCSIHYEN